MQKAVADFCFGICFGMGFCLAQALLHAIASFLAHAS